MGWIIELLWAIGMVGIPVAVITLAIVWWAMRKGHLTGKTDGKAIEQKFKAMNKKKKKGEDEGEVDKRDFFQKKWAKFGGGFYGVTAFYTYLVVEITEVTNMIINIGGLWAFIKQIDFGVLINMFVNAIMNFVAAMAWPIYWSNKMHTSRIWLWFIAAYAGYWVGMQVALMLERRRVEPDSSS